jgi:hypothetical protein
MARRIFEFRCAKEHISEKYVDESVTVIQCPHCTNDATRLISAPRISLEGITGDFPSASRAWEKRRQSHMKYERKVGISEG